jgi:hypothetical protein
MSVIHTHEADTQVRFERDQKDRNDDDGNRHHHLSQAQVPAASTCEPCCGQENSGEPCKLARLNRHRADRDPRSVPAPHLAHKQDDQESNDPEAIEQGRQTLVDIEPYQRHQ